MKASRQSLKEVEREMKGRKEGRQEEGKGREGKGRGRDEGEIVSIKLLFKLFKAFVLTERLFYSVFS